MITRSVIERKFTELRSTAEQMLERINGLPEGPERELAMLEYQCTAEIINNVGNDLTRDSRRETVKNLAILSYIQEAKKAGVTPSVNDIRENGLALAEDPKFSRVMAPQENNDSKYVLLNTLFDGSKSEHLAGWKNECTREAEDYEAEFSRFADQVPEDRRETVKNRFLRMGEFNEYIKAFDYTLKKTPEELFAYASDPTIEQKYENAVEMQDYLNTMRNKDLDLERKAVPTIPHPVPMVSGLERSFHYYLDYADTPAAASSNQETVNRLCSDLPEDREFQRKYALNILNDMLSTPDEMLYAKTPEAADKFLKEHYRTAMMFWESQKFLTDVSKLYNIPDNIKEAIRHKSRIAQTYIIGRMEKLKTDSGELHEEMNLLRSFDADTMLSILSSSNILRVSNDDGEAAEISNAANGLLDITVENDPELEKIGQYDGISVDESVFVQIAPTPTVGENYVPEIPEKPAEPHWAKRFLHMFGFFGDEFRKYEQDLKEYNDAVRLAESPNIHHSAEWRAEQANRMFNDLDKHPEKTVAAQEKERLETARRNRVDMESTKVMEKIAPMIRREQDIPFNNAVNEMIRKDGNDAIRTFIMNKMNPDMLSVARDRYKEGTDLEAIFREAAAGNMESLTAYLNGKSAQEPEVSSDGAPQTQEPAQENRVKAEENKGNLHL